MSDTACGRCGAFGDIPHGWVEGDCVLPHRNHSTRLVDGTQVCEHCVDRWDEWLREIVDLYATLSAVFFASSVAEPESEYQKPQKAPASPSPLRLTAWALAHPAMLNDHVDNGDGTTSAAYLGGNLPNIPAVLTGWAEAIWDANDWGQEWPTTVTGATAAIRSNRTTLAGLPDVDTFDTELRWVRRALRTAHGVSDPKPLGSCLNVDCGGHVWLAKDHGTPRCDRCGRRYGHLDLVRLKITEEREQEAS